MRISTACFIFQFELYVKLLSYFLLMKKSNTPMGILSPLFFLPVFYLKVATKRFFAIFKSAMQKAGPLWKTFFCVLVTFADFFLLQIIFSVFRIWYTRKLSVFKAINRSNLGTFCKK